MNEPNNMIASSCYSDTVYSTSWPKAKPISVTEQLEKWNKVRQSLYSQNGWCSENVNQISKWDVGDVVDRNGLAAPSNINMHKDSYETGTNIWNMNLTHPSHGSEQQPYPATMMQNDPFCITSNTTVGAAAAAAAAAAMSTNTPSQQLTHWENTGAIPKIYTNNNHHPTNLNCLSVTAPSNFEFPTLTPGSCSSQPQQSQPQLISSPGNQNATRMFYDCDNTNMIKSQQQLPSPPQMATGLAINSTEDDVNLALRLQFETMNLEQQQQQQQNFCHPDATNSTTQLNHAPNLNPISRTICQMSNQYHHQVDCLPKAFFID